MSTRILVGDALTMLRTLESASVQVCVTSPPYYGLRDYGVDGQIGLEQTPAAFLAALWAVFDEVQRVLRPDGLCFVNIGDSYAGSGKGPSNSLQRPASCLNDKQLANGAPPKAWMPIGAGLKPKDLNLIPQRFAIGMQDRDWWVRSEIAWCKTSAMPESVRDRPTSAWEPIWMFAKNRSYYFDADAVRSPGEAHNGNAGTFARPASVRGAALVPGQGYGTHRPDREDRVPSGANLRNYWLLGPEPSRLEHYAGFPAEIPRRCILAGSRPGDTVLDPFLGSGTTALVADRLGRDAIGIELNESYAELSRRRIASDAGTLFADPAAVERPIQATLGLEAAG